jgi:hypothetical protein
MSHLENREGEYLFIKKLASICSEGHSWNIEAGQQRAATSQIVWCYSTDSFCEGAYRLALKHNIGPTSGSYAEL